MLAMADKNGRVWGSIPGLANRAQVPVVETRKALHKFLSPDPDSRTRICEGRRIENIDGGWRLINHSKFRALRDEEERRIYKAGWIKEKRSNVDRLVDNVDPSRPLYTQAEAEAEAEAEADTDIKKKNKKMAVYKVSKQPNKLSDENWIKSLKENTAYKGIEIEIVNGKMLAWCELKNLVPTRKRLLNWLNREDRKMGKVGKTEKEKIEEWVNEPE